MVHPKHYQWPGSKEGFKSTGAPWGHAPPPASPIDFCHHVPGRPGQGHLRSGERQYLCIGGGTGGCITTIVTAKFGRAFGFKLQLRLLACCLCYQSKLFFHVPPSLSQARCVTATVCSAHCDTGTEPFEPPLRHVTVQVFGYCAVRPWCVLQFTNYTVSTTARGARCVHAADMDGDGRVDILSASSKDNKVAWYKNGGGSPITWTPYNISTSANGAYYVHAADIDGDGRIDVLSASELDNKIAWYKNGGGSPPTWTPYTISSSASGARSVIAVDVDSDGRLDVVSASLNDDKVAWYKNGGGNPPTWTPYTISTAADGAVSVFAADLDGDGRTDVLSTSIYDNKVAWYKNGGGAPPTWTPYTISTSARYAYFVFAAVMGWWMPCLQTLGATTLCGTRTEEDHLPPGPPTTFPQWRTGQPACLQRTWTVMGGWTYSRRQVSPTRSRGTRMAGDPQQLGQRPSSPPSPTMHTLFLHVDGDGRLDALSASIDDNKIAVYTNTMCLPGSYGPGSGGMVPCTLCPAGRFNNESMQTSCSPCPGGRYGSVVGATNSTSGCGGTCVSGYACPAGSSTPTAVPCPAGYFSGPGASVCNGCPAGTFSDRAGQSSCTACPAYTVSVVVGATVCLPACPVAGQLAVRYVRYGACVWWRVRWHACVRTLCDCDCDCYGMLAKHL
jgi:hypothetical protein